MMPNSRHISLSKKGQYQVLLIPHEFALSGTEVLLRQESDRLIIEPIASTSLIRAKHSGSQVDMLITNIYRNALPLQLA